MKQVETQLQDQEYELLKAFKEKNGLKTDYQGLKELVKALDIPDFNQEQFNQEIQEEWVDELKLWFDNDGQMYRSRYIPFLKNYARKKKRGIYEKELAIKGIKNNLVNDIIKAYSKDMGGTPTLQEINMATRKKLAEEIVDRIEGEINDEGVEGVLSYKQEVKLVDRTNLENWVKDLGFEQNPKRKTLEKRLEILEKTLEKMLSEQGYDSSGMANVRRDPKFVSAFEKREKMKRQIE